VNVVARTAYDELLALPEHVIGEILEGALHVSPRPASRHARSSSRLGGRLIPPFDEGNGGPGGWIILFEPELHLADDVVVPDLAGWRRERMAEMPDAAWFALAPDWVCEVLSPSTARSDRTKKLRIYAREKVSWTWLIDPVSRTLEVFRLEGASWLLVAAHADAEVVRAEPFDAVELPLASLWAT